MLRRTVLGALATLGAGATLDSDLPWKVFSALAREDTVGADHDRWNEIAWEYGYTYLSTPRTDLVAELSADIAALGQTIERTANERFRHGLRPAGTRMAVVMAMAQTDLGRFRSARHWWWLARQLADASGDRDLAVWVRGNESMIGLYQRRPLPVVVTVAEQAVAVAGRQADAGTAEAFGAKAQALALMGRADEALDALRAAEQTFDRLPSTVTGECESIYGWPRQRLHHIESFVHTHLGGTAAAYQAQQCALALYAADRVVSRSQIGLHRAVCLVKDGEIGEGLRQAATTVDRLPVERRLRYVTTIADRVLDAVPERERGRPEMDELRSVLAVGRQGEEAS